MIRNTLSTLTLAIFALFTLSLTPALAGLDYTATFKLPSINDNGTDDIADDIREDGEWVIQFATDGDDISGLTHRSFTIGLGPEHLVTKNFTYEDGELVIPVRAPNVLETVEGYVNGAYPDITVPALYFDTYGKEHVDMELARGASQIYFDTMTETLRSRKFAEAGTLMIGIEGYGRVETGAKRVEIDHKRTRGQSTAPEGRVEFIKTFSGLALHLEVSWLYSLSVTRAGGQSGALYPDGTLQRRSPMGKSPVLQVSAQKQIVTWGSLKARK